mgnify:FL=1
MNETKVIETAADAAAIIANALPRKQTEERVYVLPLDANGKMLTKPILVSVGHTDGTTTIDAGAVFREALTVGAEEIIVAHNHPSGDLTPSKADLAATKELKDLAERLGVVFLDHLVMGPGIGGDFVSIVESYG